MSLAPVALFVYKRLSHTRETIESLLQNKESKKTSLLVFSDGPKTAHESGAVEQVRQYIRGVSGFESVQLIAQDKNLGLANSIIQGVTWAVNQYGRVIVLEDDLAVSPYFLQFMNESLTLYEDNPKVISVHGYVYPIQNLPETFFLKGADCWGWATWRDAWRIFEPNATKLYEKLIASGLQNEFDFNGQSKYTQMLKNQIEGKIDSWAIRWYASAFLNDRYTLYSGRALVNNTGADASGTHVPKTDIYNNPVRYTPVVLAKQPVVQSEQAYEAFCGYYRSVKPSIWTKLRNQVGRLLA